ncbi:MAG TPA: EpsI family protein [Oligoflexia bacterium]|nr:EpsI family protein [Oligoflexia bacterium]HMP47169.1 EpsI family protein [Oligoflexia bacterium]
MKSIKEDNEMSGTLSLGILKVNRKGLWISCIFLAIFSLCFKSLLTSEYVQNENQLDQNSASLNFNDFPSSLGNWTAGADIGIDIRALDVLQLSSYVKRTYTNPEGKKVFLYLGYWNKQTGEHQAAKHSPALCLPSNGWITTNLSDLNFPFSFNNNQEIQLKIRRIIGEKRGASTLFYYWFFAGSEYYSQEWYALINLSLQNLFYGRNDGGIVEIAADISRAKSSEEAINEAENTLKSFLADLSPYLHSKIRKKDI